MYERCEQEEASRVRLYSSISGGRVAAGTRAYFDQQHYSLAVALLPVSSLVDRERVVTEYFDILAGLHRHLGSNLVSFGAEMRNSQGSFTVVSRHRHSDAPRLKRIILLRELQFDIYMAQRVP